MASSVRHRPQAASHERLLAGKLNRARERKTQRVNALGR
jgi:hypothetical protein